MDFAKHLADSKARMERDRSDAKEKFQQWMARPEVKLMLSLIPPASPAEALPMALEHAFLCGVECGQGQATTQIVEVMLKSMPKPD